VQEALAIGRDITRLPAHDLGGLVAKLEPLWWWIKLDDSILDAEAARWLASFRRELRRLTHADR
jgi:hypothetical protein